MSERHYAGSFAAGGITFTVETNRSDLARLVGDVFRDLRVTDGGQSPVVFEVLHRGTPPPSNPWAVWRDGKQRAKTVADSYVVIYLLWEISRLMFEQTGQRVHLHSAALAHNRRAVALAGRSRAGKSTLAAWLTHKGWGFLTDEATLVDPETLVVSPFWRPINVRRPGPLESLLANPPSDTAEVLVPASTIGKLAQATPLAVVAFPTYGVEKKAAIRPMSPATALMELTQHFPGLVAGGRAGFKRLARLVESVPAYALEYHDLDDAERVLRELVTEAS